MIVNKDVLLKIEVIARKMSKLSFGDFDSLKLELIQRFVSLKLNNEMQSLGIVSE